MDHFGIFQRFSKIVADVSEFAATKNSIQVQIRKLDSDDESYTEAQCKGAGGEWTADSVNFDNVYCAMYAIFQMSNNAWVDLMFKAGNVTDMASIFFFMF